VKRPGGPGSPAAAGGPGARSGDGSGGPGFSGAPSDTGGPGARGGSRGGKRGGGAGARGGGGPGGSPKHPAGREGGAGTGDMPDGTPAITPMGDTGGLGGAGASEPEARKPWEVRTGRASWVDLDIGEEAEAAIDNEAFEVLDEFDADMKEMLIDVVNEKLRRLLLLDVSKFEGGKLPYGIRPQQDSSELVREIEKIRQYYQEIIRGLEDREKEMLARIEKLELEKLKLKTDLDEALKALKGKGNPPVADKPQRSREPLPQPEEDKEPVVIRETVTVPSGGFTEKDLRDRISEATKDLRRRIAELETENGKQKKRIEELEARVAELEKKEKELQQKLAAAEAAAAAAAKNRTGQRPPPDVPAPPEKIHFCQMFSQTDRIATNARGVQCKPCSPPHSPPGSHAPEKCDRCIQKHEEMQDNSEALNRSEVALKASQGMLRKLLMKVDSMVDAPRDDSVQKALDRHIGSEVGGGLSKADGSPAEVNSFVSGASGEAHQNVMPAFAKWVAQTNAALDAFRKRPPPKAPPPETKVVTVERERDPPAREDLPRPPTPPGVEPIVIDHTEEVDKLRQKVQDQQDEIARLLLIIEELRHRFEQMKDAVVNKGGQVAESFTEAIQEAGLTELVEAPPSYSLNLKNVYERLYQDAIQRMQRLALIMEQKAAANELYLATMACAAARRLRGVPPPVAPDLQRLTEAALTAINGMWYHYDILFRRVCEGSAESGVRDSASNTYRLALADCFAMPGGMGPFQDRVRKELASEGGLPPSPFAEALWAGSQASEKASEKKVMSLSGPIRKAPKTAEPTASRTPAPRTAETRRRRLESEGQDEGAST